MNSFAPTKLFTLAESGYKPENIWQKQSSEKRQLRKLFLPATFPARIERPAHTLLLALCSSALSTILSLQSHSQHPNRTAPGKNPVSTFLELGGSMPGNVASTAIWGFFWSWPKLGITFLPRERQFSLDCWDYTLSV